MVRFEDFRIIKLLEKADMKTVSIDYLHISHKALLNRVRRLRIRAEKTRLWLNYYESQRKRKSIHRLLTPTPREVEVARLEYLDAMEKIMGEEEVDK